MTQEPAPIPAPELDGATSLDRDPLPLASLRGPPRMYRLVNNRELDSHVTHVGAQGPAPLPQTTNAVCCAPMPSRCRR